MLKNLGKSIRTDILIGLFLTLPVAATVLISNFLLNFTTDWLPDKVFSELRKVPGGTFLLQLATLIAVLLVFYLVGVLTRNFFGKRLFQWGDRLLAGIPFIRTIYISIRQISESLFSHRKTLFKEVVLIEYPRKDIYSIAFVTASPPQEVSRGVSHAEPGEDCLTLFIPTSPIPTSGFLIFAPRSQVIPLAMSVADAIKLVMSAGAVVAEDPKDSASSFVDKLDSWLRPDDGSSPKKKKDAAPGG